MKRLILSIIGVMTVLGILLNAKEIVNRKVLNIEEKTFSTIMLNTQVPTKIFFPSREPQNAVIQFALNKTKSEKKYFEKINFIFYNFLRNYKIGNTNKKKNLVLWTNDNRGLFVISFDNLKLLNDRDFGAKDGKNLTNGKVVLPFKEVIRKGYFKATADEKGIKKRFIRFLNNYSVGLFETTVETTYYHTPSTLKESKENNIGWSIEKKEYDGDSVKYFIMCRPGGMTILTAIPRLNEYWDSHGKMHDSLSNAASRSCNK